MMALPLPLSVASAAPGFKAAVSEVEGVAAMVVVVVVVSAVG